MYSYSSGCNNAASLRDVTVADGEEKAPLETFTKTWRLLNTGDCSWSRSYSVVFIDGADMSATSADAVFRADCGRRRPSHGHARARHRNGDGLSHGHLHADGRIGHQHARGHDHHRGHSHIRRV
jgi:hypothetical protein